MQQPLTVKQRAVLEFVGEQIRERGCSPSLQEIGNRFSLSSLATVHKHLTNLADKGYITRRWNRSRSITLLWQSDCCPTCGRVLPPTERAETI